MIIITINNNSDGSSGKNDSSIDEFFCHFKIKKFPKKKL